jgi:DNA-binding transcriptional LysR family regulator
MHCMIDVRKLEILRELDRCGTIAATAAAVHLTPSAVSQQLAALSKEAGTAMLEPDGRRVRLTEAAQLLLQHAHQIFTHLEHAESDLAAFRRGDAGTVRVGTFSSAVKALAVPLVSDLSTRTRIRVELREVQPEDALDALLGRRVDICMNLATTELLPGSDDKRVHSEHLLDDVMDVALPFDHPLADRAEIELADLANEDWILANPGVPCWQLSRDATTPTNSSAWSGWSRPATGSACSPGSPNPRPCTNRSCCDPSPGSARFAGSACRPGPAPPTSRTSRPPWSPCAGSPPVWPGARWPAAA